MKKRFIIILAAAALAAAASILCYYLAIRDNRSVADYTASADAMIFAGDYGGAVAECSDGLRRYPESAELYILKARAYLLSGDTDKALGTLDYGYKQTQSGIILEQRGQLAVIPDDVEFLPLTEPLTYEEEQDGSPEAPDLSDGGEAAGALLYRQPDQGGDPGGIPSQNIKGICRSGSSRDGYRPGRKYNRK